jgi:BirA family biotin operon repressor/biotin-[acetyl-CoA-carboxylase] ligase
VSLELPQVRALASRLEVLEEAGSTNSELVARAASGWPDRSVLVTDRQTAGRGRLGRAWTAPPGTSLAVSVLVRPAIPRDRYGWLSLLAGVAMTEAVRLIGGAADLKWPNDVLIGGRKVAGILAEAREDRVVLGLGVNVNVPEAGLPQEVDRPATSLLVETGRDLDRAELLVEVLERLERRYDAWLSAES